MTEAEWLECDRPKLMLQFLKGKVGERKPRLFACGLWRQHEDRLPASLLQVIATAEQVADGLSPWTDLVPLQPAALGVAAGSGATAGEEAVRAVYRRIGADWGWWSPAPSGDPRVTAIQQQACRLLRCIFGNPFRPVQVDQAWLRWHDGTAVHMAQAIYDDRRFQDLPVLADALEEAGCTDPEILGHCRGPGEHVRGCWVLDLVRSVD
jgi:hypothetical protein